MRIDREAFNQQLFDEIMPLGQKCWEESTRVKAESCAFYGDRDFAIEPALETYQQLSDANSLIIVTLRDDDLKGYIIGFLYRSWHHKKLLCGSVDSIYVEPECRAYTLVLTGRFEKEMKAAGAVIIGWWIMVVLRLSAGETEQDFPFMDGPYRLTGHYKAN